MKKALLILVLFSGCIEDHAYSPPADQYYDPLAKREHPWEKQGITCVQWAQNLLLKKYEGDIRELEKSLESATRENEDLKKRLRDLTTI